MRAPRVGICKAERLLLREVVYAISDNREGELDMTRRTAFAALWLSALAVFLCAGALAHAAEASKDAYPIDTCIVSGKKLGEMGDAVIINHKGREVRFCCAG